MFSDTSVFLEQIAQLESSDSVALRVFAQCFYPHESILLRRPKDGGKARLCEPKRSREETSVDPCCLSDFLPDVTSVSKVCTQHKSHGGKTEDYITSQRETVPYGPGTPNIL